MHIKAAGGNTVLMCAATHGGKSVVERALSLTSDVNESNSQGHTALMIAANLGHADAVHVLLKSGASVSAVDDNGLTALHYAVKGQHANLMSALLDKATPDEETSLLRARDSNGRTALVYACLLADEAAVSLLLQHIATAVTELELSPLDIPSRDKRTCVHFAAHAGHVAILEHLINAHARLDARDAFGRTALHVAIERAQPQAVRLLASSAHGDALMRCADNDGMRPIHLLANQKSEQHTVEMLEALLAAGAEADARDYSGASLLHQLCHRNIISQAGTLRLVRRLLVHKPQHASSSKDSLSRTAVDPSASDDDAGWSPLHYALDSLSHAADSDTRSSIQQVVDLMRSSSSCLSSFDPSRPRDNAADGYLKRRGAHNQLPVADRADVLRGERSIDGIAKRLLRTDLPPQRVVVLLGAGASTSAGIPDYRSNTGLYATSKGGRDAFNPAAFAEDHVATWSFLRRTFGPAVSGEMRPTPAHRFIAMLHAKDMLQRVYSQNIDGLEVSAGVPDEKLVCCHGSVRKAHCASCGAEADALSAFNMEEGAPRCASCDTGIVRPGVVWFGEALPRRFETLQTEDLEACTLLLIMGTTLQVYPFASLPSRCPLLTPRLLINQEAVGPFREPDLGAHEYRDVAWLGSCDEGVGALIKALGWNKP